MPFGRQVLTTNAVFPTRVNADGSPVYKAGGVTLDLTKLAAASNADTTLPDGSIIKAGFQFLRYGQVLTKITVTESDTVTITGSPTGGTFTITVAGQTTAGIAYNAAASAVQTAVAALSTVGAGNVTVTGSAGGPYTLVFNTSLGGPTVTASGAGLTGGTTPAATAAQVNAGVTNDLGKFGPYDPAATDGRATLTRGECVILDQTWTYGPSSYPLPQSNEIMGGCLEGGLVWLDRIIQSGVAGHSLALGPTKAELLAAFPGIFLVEN